MVFSRAVVRAATAAPAFRGAPIARRSDQQQCRTSRRFYASGKGSGERRSSGLPWLLGAIGVAGALIFYLQRSGPVKKSPLSGSQYGAGKEDSDRWHAEEQKIPSTAQQESKEKNAALPSSSEIDEARAMKPPAGVHSMSAKQQNLSNADTMNPFMNEPGKSVKGEGETETAKLKGTVSPGRPQE